VGKTRLAVSMADTWRLHSEPVADFVSFVDLASLVDPDLVTETLAAQLGLHEQPGRAVVATVVDAIQSARGLLILDNCEHLIDACARVVNELLIACPKLHIMSTSRQPLGIAGEVVCSSSTCRTFELWRTYAGVWMAYHWPSNWPLPV
jgi:predicted ATPase